MSQALRFASNLFAFREITDEKQNEAIRGPQEIQRESISDKERLQRVVEKINDSKKGGGSVTLGRIKLENTNLSAVTTLGDLKATDGNPLQRKLIDSLQLNKSIDELNKYFPFFERLKKVSYDVLDHVSLFSLQLVQVLENSRVSVIVDALIEEEALIAIPVQELEDRKNLKIFTLRMNHLHTTRPDLLIRLAQTPFEKPDSSENLSLSAARLSLMPTKDILEISDKLPAGAFGLLTDDQVKELDFSKLSTEQIIKCIRGGIDDQKTIQRRFSILSPQQLSVVFQVVEDEVLSHFPIASVGNLPVAVMTKQQLESLFCNFRIPEGEQRQRVTMLSSDAINSILPKLDRDFLLLLSDDHIRGLDYSKVEKEQLGDIFCSWKLGEKEKARKTALIPPHAMRLVVKIANRELLKSLTQEQILALDLDSLDNEQIENIFFYWSLQDKENKAKISILPVPSINGMIHRGFFDVLKYISDEQLSQIDLQNIPPEHLNTLFPTLDPANWHPGHTYSIKPNFQGRNKHDWEQVTSTGSSYTSLDEREVAQIIEQRKAQCQKNFQILSQHEQFAAIRGKISPEILVFLNQ